MTSLVQLRHPRHGRAAALVIGAELRLLPQFDSIYSLAASALTRGLPLSHAVHQAATGEALSYDAVHSGASPWRLLPAMDHPTEPARCMVAGTGLTHRQSAANRNAMHADPTAKPTDSMVMYQWGVDGGRPPAGRVGTSPEWFYKGTGAILRGHLDPLTVPAYACDGGEEAEVAGIYIIDAAGTPRRLGFAQGNEFSDHVFEKKNYLYLASSKLRECSIGPELVLDASFDDLPGNVAIHRGTSVLWRKSLLTGEAAMCHSLANMEHHHFKFAPHRRPGDVHIHFFGAGAFSFGEGIQLEADDVMEVSFDQLGRSLRNPLAVERGGEQLAVVQPL
ncbi:MAG: GguC protein [Acidobacteria bacterium]|nr:GguC protein [Acidobacteriota bacterium]